MFNIKAHSSNSFTAVAVSLSEYQLSDCEYRTLGAAVGVSTCAFGDTVCGYFGR